MDCAQEPPKKFPVTGNAQSDCEGKGSNSLPQNPS